MTVPKKKMSLPYLPARLVRGKHRWYIVYHQTNPVTGRRERFRETFDINRIPDKRERVICARRMIAEINNKLPGGFPFDQDFITTRHLMTLEEAVIKARDIKLQATSRSRTRDTYESVTRVFLAWASEHQLSETQIHQFDRYLCMAFLDHMMAARWKSNKTRNNYVDFFKAMFNALVDRNLLIHNPWTEISDLPITGKRRRAFNQDEKNVVADAIYQKDKALMLGVLLQYYCFLRPIEQRRLRFHNFDITGSLIRLEPEITKNKRAATITIPDVLMPYLREYGFESHPKGWKVFGKDGNPHATDTVGHNTLNSRHKAILERLEEKGLISNIKGLSFYSWKDTGAMELVRQKVNIREIQLQMRHSSLEETQKYLESLGYQYGEIKSLNNKLIHLNWKDVRNDQIQIPPTKSSGHVTDSETSSGS